MTKPKVHFRLSHTLGPEESNIMRSRRCAPELDAAVATVVPETSEVAATTQAGALDHPVPKHLARGFSAIFATAVADKQVIGRYKPIVFLPPSLPPLLPSKFKKVRAGWE